MKLFKNVTKSGEVFLSYPLNATADVGFFPEGEAIIITDAVGGEIIIQPTEITQLRSLLRYCESHCIATQEEEFYE